MSFRLTAHDLLPFLTKPKKYTKVWLEEVIEDARSAKRSIWRQLRKEGVELKPTGKEDKSGYWRDSRGRFLSKEDRGYRQALKARLPKVKPGRIKHKGKRIEVVTRYGETFDARWYGPYPIIPPVDHDQLWFAWKKCHHMDKTRIIITFDYYDVDGKFRGNAGTTSSYFFPDEFDSCAQDILTKIGREGNYKNIIALKGITIVTRSAGVIPDATDKSSRHTKKRKKR
jgi:hypothetical protein